MAVLPRRDWADLQTEHVNRMGRSGDSNYTTRAQEFLAAAYYDVCTSFHHFELDKRDTSSLTCSTSSNLVDASGLNIHIIFGVQIRQVGGNVIQALRLEEGRFSLHKFKHLQRQPESYARYGDELVFPVIPDAAYPITIHYYSDPTAPDFAAPTSPEIAREWDEHVLELSLAYAHGALWQMELASYWQARFDQWAQKCVNPPLLSVPLHGRPEAQTRTLPHGGVQG